jgi:hypothetical protein
MFPHPYPDEIAFFPFIRVDSLIPYFFLGDRGERLNILNTRSWAASKITIPKQANKPTIFTVQDNSSILTLLSCWLLEESKRFPFSPA